MTPQFRWQRRLTGRGRRAAGEIVRGILRIRSIALAVLPFLVGACLPSTQAGIPTNLRVLMTDDWAKTRPFLDAVRLFELEHPGVRITVDKSPINQVKDRVIAASNAGFPLDVVQWHAALAAAQGGLAEPVDDLWTAHGLKRSDFHPGAIEDVTWAAPHEGSHLYGVPLDVNTVALLYNADDFASEGLALPNTWATFGDLERAAQTLATDSRSRQAIALTLSGWVTGGWVAANGGKLVVRSPDGTLKPTLESPPVVETLSFLGRLVNKNYAFVARVDSRDALALFQSGKVSLLPTGSWDLVKLRRREGGGKYRAAPLPNGVSGKAGGTALGGSSLFIAKGSQHRELAFEFMQHLISDPYALRFAEEEGRLPTRNRVYRDHYFQEPNIRVFVEQLKSGPIIQGGTLPLSDYGAAIRKVLVDHEDAADALHEAQIQTETPK